jgi:tripartite-type tricarboxylate transporter receptor subunit TctC
MTACRLGRRAALSLLSAAAGARAVAANPVLDRPTRIVIGTPPGGGEDVLARLLAEALRDRYAPNVVVENRPGASNRIAVEAVKAAAPDGTTILQVPLPVMTLFPHIFPRTTRYDGAIDFVPVCTVATVTHGWVVRADHPAATLPAFLVWARGRGGTTFAPPVIGSPPHMIGATVARLAGVQLTAVPYRGGAPALQDLLGGRLDAVISHMGDLVPLLRAGQTRLLAVNSVVRLPAWPDVATFAESGFGTLPAGDAMALFLPARTPPALVAALHGAVEAAVATPPLRQGFMRLEMTAHVTAPVATAERVRTEHDRWGEIARAIGFTAEEG